MNDSKDSETNNWILILSNTYEKGTSGQEIVGSSNLSVRIDKDCVDTYSEKNVKNLPNRTQYFSLDNSLHLSTKRLNVVCSFQRSTIVYQEGDETINGRVRSL
jgi:hypothetical protein